MITVGILVAIFVGLPVLCYFDPAGHYAAEVKRRQSESS